jgi:hypothetical protein
MNILFPEHSYERTPLDPLSLYEMRHSQNRDLDQPIQISQFGWLVGRLDHPQTR